MRYRGRSAVHCPDNQELNRQTPSWKQEDFPLLDVDSPEAPLSQDRQTHVAFPHEEELFPLLHVKVLPLVWTSDIEDLQMEQTEDVSSSPALGSPSADRYASSCYRPEAGRTSGWPPASPWCCYAG